MRKTVLASLIIVIVMYSLPAKSHSSRTLTIGEQQLLNNEFLDFEYLYDRRQKKTNEPDTRHWIDLVSYLKIALDKSRNNSEIGRDFHLRIKLMIGESYVFASQKAFKARDQSYIKYFEMGIKTLEETIVEIENRKGYNMVRDIDRLPAWSNEALTNGKPHRYAGYESIGTGFEKGSAQWSIFSGKPTFRDVTWEIKPFLRLKKYHEMIKFVASLDPNGQRPWIEQVSTSKTARRFLAAYCPWGVDMYFQLKNAGLLADVDLRILRPYAGRQGKLMLAKILENMDIYFSSTNQDYVSLKPPPLVSDATIKSTQAPFNLIGEMNRVIGANASDGNKYHRDVIGNLRLSSSLLIKWKMIESPTYQVWRVSPTIWDMQYSDYLKLWFVAVNIWFGNYLGVVLDEVVPLSTKGINYLIGGQLPNLPFVSNILTVGVDDSFNLVKSKLYGTTATRQSFSGLLTKGDWFSWTDLTRTIASFGCQKYDEWQSRQHFQGLDPKAISLGKSYDGSLIPPVVVRGNVVGVGQLIRDRNSEPAFDEYPLHVNLVRFYAGYPAVPQPDSPGIWMDRSRYDLQRNPDLFPVKSIRWIKLNDSQNSFEIVSSFAPKSQSIIFILDQQFYETLKAIQEAQAAIPVRTRGGLARRGISAEAELWTTTPGEQRKYASVILVQDGVEPLNSFTIWLLNQDHPESQRKAKTGRFGPSPEYKRHIVEVLVPLKTRYELRLKINGQYKETHQVVLHSGLWKSPGRKDHVTGKLSFDDKGNAYLVHEPKIKLPIVQVREGMVQTQ